MDNLTVASCLYERRATRRGKTNQRRSVGPAGLLGNVVPNQLRFGRAFRGLSVCASRVNPWGLVIPT